MIDGVTDKAAIAGLQGDRSGRRLPPELALLLFDESSLSLSLRRSNGVLVFFCERQNCETFESLQGFKVIALPQ